MLNTEVISQPDLCDLYQDHHPWLQRWLQGRLGNAMDAEDLAQDTFVRVIRSSQNIPSLNEPRSYLVTIARGLTIDLFRKRSLEQQYLEALAQLPEAQWPSEEDRAVMLETLLELDIMLAGLGNKVRLAFILSQFDGLTYEQVSVQLDVSLRTVKNYMAKAIEHCCLYRLDHRL
ncbi:sigma-70 family RNA polymerase sigma factor [Halopseudomonas sp.]|uniref:sigma-70 family RNA polymerase sigma factor n=1 Tax=Halopseudomonas sp. TaxID=2901191 RepID=UPI003002D5ED